MHRFIISGFKINSLGEDMKKQARRSSHRIVDCDEMVKSCGPFAVKNRYGKKVTRHLTKRELVFGLKDFAGLVSWISYPNNKPDEVVIDIRARMLGAGDWIIDFVRKVIQEPTCDRDNNPLKDSWQIVSEVNPFEDFKRF